MVVLLSDANNIPVVLLASAYWEANTLRQSARKAANQMVHVFSRLRTGAT